MSQEKMSRCCAGLRQLEREAVTKMKQQHTTRAFMAWRLHARRDAELRRRLRVVVYRMLMGRLAGAFAGWRITASQLAYDRRLVHSSVARLRLRVRITPF